MTFSMKIFGFPKEGSYIYTVNDDKTNKGYDSIKIFQM